MKSYEPLLVIPAKRLNVESSSHAYSVGASVVLSSSRASSVSANITSPLSCIFSVGMCDDIDDFISDSSIVGSDGESSIALPARLELLEEYLKSKINRKSLKEPLYFRVEYIANNDSCH